MAVERHTDPRPQGQVERQIMKKHGTGHVLGVHKHTLHSSNTGQIARQLIILIVFVMKQNCYGRGKHPNTPALGNIHRTHLATGTQAGCLSHNALIKWWTWRPSAFESYQDQITRNEAWRQNRDKYLNSTKVCNPGLKTQTGTFGCCEVTPPPPHTQYYIL